MTVGTPSIAAESDERLVSRMAQGDEAALGSLYDRYASILYPLAHRIVRERTDAEDIVLATFTQAWRGAGAFEPTRGSPAAWLAMMCRSRALDMVRARGRRDRVADRVAASEETAAMGRPQERPDRGVETSERSERVKAALASLSQPQREAIELAYFEGLSHSEIAQLLDQPLGTIKTRVRLAMQKLREALRPYFNEAYP